MKTRIQRLFLGLALLASLTSLRADTVYVSNYGGGNYSIEKITASGEGTVFATNGLSYPHGLAFDSAGNLYVANLSSSLIWKFAPDGSSSVFATNSLNATISAPVPLVFDSTGNLYVGNTGNYSITKLTPGGVGTNFANSSLNQPAGLAFDSAGNLFVANGHSYSGGNYIMKFTPDGVGTNFSSSVLLHNPAGMAFDSAGNLFVANQDNSTIVKFTPDGSGSVFATNGLHQPVGIAFDSAGNLYAANVVDSTIAKFTPDGTYSLFANSSNGVNSPRYLAIWPDPVLTNIVLIPTGSIIAVSSNQQFNATGYFNDGSDQILTSNLTWSSSNPVVATINANGLVTGLTAGATAITAISGSVSNSTTLTVVAQPAITIQPTNNTVSRNGSVTLRVAATGGDLIYQWQLNGTNISGATGATYNIPGVASTNVGVYTVVVSNLAGSVTSQAAIVGTTAIQMFAGIIVNGPIGTNYVIQSEAILNSGWITRTNLALPSQPYIYIDYSSPTNPQQFYQAMPQ